jgi:septal ring factor EnvC (AmiA/AmiB activator)
MRSDRVLVLMVVALFLLMLLTYARFNHLEQTMTRQRLTELNGRLDTLISTLKDSESRFKVYADNMELLKERMETAENERKDIWGKVERMAKEVEGLRTSVIASNLETDKKIVELGSISVKKSRKNK